MRRPDRVRRAGRQWKASVGQNPRGVNAGNGCGSTHRVEISTAVAKFRPGHYHCAMKAHILSIGTELVTGQIVDTNAAWITERLHGRGVEITGHTTVPDDLDAIVETLGRLTADHALLVVTGGLGPTEDDLTRTAIARALGAELLTDADALATLRRFFAVRGRPMPPANVVQAQIPAGAEAISNPCGTAPGIRARVNGAWVFAMPGVPREMRRMFDAAVAPFLAEADPDRCVASASLHTFGTTESELGERVRDLMARGRNPAVGTTATGGVISLRIHAIAASPAEAADLLDHDIAEIRERLGDLVFGRDADTLSGVVGRALLARGATVTTAESCTGGLVAKRLTDVPGASDFLHRAVVTYANEAKVSMLGVPRARLEAEGAVSPEVAEAMARGARERADADYALALTGIAGPDGGTDEKPVGLVYIALAHPGGVEVKAIRCGRDQPRREIRSRSAAAALDLLRLHLAHE